MPPKLSESICLSVSGGLIPQSIISFSNIPSNVLAPTRGVAATVVVCYSRGNLPCPMLAKRFHRLDRTNTFYECGYCFLVEETNVHSGSDYFQAEF